MTRITGHRGARDLWPENSLTGFRNALALGCDAIEFDVHLSADGELLVIHDPTLDRTTGASGPVAALTREARQAIRLTGSEDGIPTLDEVLAVLAPATVDLHVEIKLDAAGQPYPDLPARIADRLRAHGLAGRSHLTSFSLEVLEDCREAAPEIARLVSADESWIARHGGADSFFRRIEGLVGIVALRHDYLAQHLEEVTRRWPAERLCAWTVNDPEGIGFWLRAGIGHLTTDRPDIALDLRAGVPA